MVSTEELKLHNTRGQSLEHTRMEANAAREGTDMACRWSAGA